MVVASFHQLGAEIGRALAPGGNTARERARIAALTSRLSATLAPIQTDFARTLDPASNGEVLADRGVTELRQAMGAFARLGDDRSAAAFKQLRDETLVALSDWDGGARIVWSMAGLPPPLP